MPADIDKSPALHRLNICWTLLHSYWIDTCMQVLYCPQTRVSAKGTPSELYFAAQQLQAQKGRPRGDLPALIQQLGLEPGVLNQPWPELSVSSCTMHDAATQRRSL